jgi:nucleoside-diphosphate-sugar epimerase
MHRIIKEDVEKITEDLASFKPRIKGKKFLITGCAGFLGSWLSDVICAMDGEVIGVENFISGSKENIEHLLNAENFKLIERDVCEFDTEEKIDYILHMASIASPPLYQKYPVKTLDANVLGIKRMLELGLKNKIKGFMFGSTSEVYGKPHDEMIPTPEHFYGYVNSYGPRAMYDEGKRAGEAYCYAYFLEHNLPVRIARIFNTYGPRLDIKSTSLYGRVLIKFIHQALYDDQITIYGDGKQTRAFCYVSDTIEGLIKLLLTEGLNGEVMNIGNNEETSILALAKLIHRLTNSKAEFSFNHPPQYDIRDDPKRRCPDISRAKEKIGFNPRISLEEGLIKTIEWYKDMMRKRGEK